MPIVEIHGQNVEFPDDLNPQQLTQAVSKAAEQLGGTPGSEQKSLIRKGWDALAIPEKKSREGLKILADMSGPKVAPEYTGNLPRDIAMNIGKVAVDSLADTAPGFISRGAIVTAGALKAAQGIAPLAKLGLRSIAGQGESFSGAAPGSLESAYKDSSLMFSKGKKAVQATYDAAKEGISSDLASTPGKADFVNKAVQFADEGRLNPTEALEARKELDKIKRTLTDTFYRSAREKLDSIAKQAFSGADAEYQRAVKAESLRNFFPQNKYGGASSFKVAVGEGMKNLGLPGAAVGAILSPAVQGITATGAGLVGRYGIAPVVSNAVRSASLASAALETLAKKRKGK